MDQATGVSQHESAYVNVMESLVTEEVDKQLQNVPPKIRRYLKPEEMVTYALNRLPTLYASSEQGWRHQRKLAKRDMNRKIQNTVHQAIMAVQIDPIRLSKPISVSQNQEAEAVLQALQTLFQAPDLSWATALNKLHEFKNNSVSIESVEARHAQAWRPENSRGRVAWTHRRPRPAKYQNEPKIGTNEASNQSIGWDNVLYRL